MSKKVFAIIQREYITRAKTKGFIIGTLIFPLILILMLGGVFLFSKIYQPSTKSFVVLDQTQRIYPEFIKLLSDTLSNGASKYIFSEQNTTTTLLDTTLAQLQQQVLDKKIDGYLVIPADVVESRKVRYSARNVSNFDEQRDMRNALSRIVVNERLANRGYPAEEIRNEMWQGRVSLVSRQVTKQGEVKKSGASSFGLTYVLTYVMFLQMMIYGTMVMRSVIEEKSQRITETIIAAIRPVELMVGKIVGICALSVTQLISVGLVLLIIVVYGEPLFLKMGINTPEILNFVRQINFSAQLFTFLITYFIIGFLLYATLYAGLGAIVNSEDEGQQNQTPIIFTIIISFFIMFPVAQNPDTSMAFWTSLVPIFTPIVMFARVAVSDPVLPSGAILSLFICGLTIVFLMYFVARVYRVGILMYGKKPSLKEAIKWIRYQ